MTADPTSPMFPWHFPRHINIETSDHCNRGCTFCPIQRDRPAHAPRLLDMALFDKALADIARAPVKVKLSLQWIDEPLTNPAFFEYAARARQACPDAFLMVQTNGDFLDAPRAERLSQLFDAVAVNLYTASAHRAFENKRLELAKSAQGHVIAMPGRITRPPGGEARGAVWHINEKFHDEDWVEDYSQPSQPANAACHRLWTQAAISFDGDVHICCRDNEKRHPVGNLSDMSLTEAYNGPTARGLREHMQKGRRDRIAMCHVCEKAAHDPFVALGRNDAETFGLAGGVVRGPGQPEPALVDHQMPWGCYDYETARSAAMARDHVVLPGFLPHRYEVVVGLTEAAARQIVGQVRHRLGDAVRGIWVCGSRVVTRRQLKLIDPTVFADAEGTLRIGNNGRLRELSKDPRTSSDLDIKVLIARGALDDRARGRAERDLGALVEDVDPYIPLSGHPRPILHLVEVPDDVEDARAAFADYNARRRELLNKGPLSLEYVQLLFDPMDDVEPFGASGVRADIEARMVAAPAPGPGGWGTDVDAEEKGRRLRMVVDDVTVHQWMGAMTDNPGRVPRRLVDGTDDERSLLAWARDQVVARDGS